MSSTSLLSTSPSGARQCATVTSNHNREKRALAVAPHEDAVARRCPHPRNLYWHQEPPHPHPPPG
eukprot:scaffold20211_cov129-Isochrysis_galbana.AAC.1